MCNISLFTPQLLGAVIQHEKPELEVQKSKLLKQEEELKIELAKLEDALLEVTKGKNKKTNKKGFMVLEFWENYMVKF